MKELRVYWKEVSNMNETDSEKYIINKLEEAGFDLSSDNNVLHNEYSEEGDYVNFTLHEDKEKQKEKENE